ncbi:MAG: CfrBI family restriction endonuclease [Acidobacteria bacterium]|nr:CfrBI family restriction endonuclease [Acidobacteriota bacterium]
MTSRKNPDDLTLDDLFPEGGRILLTGGGRDFVERIGVEAIRDSILSVMMGDNIRTQTEPLSRRKIAIVSGALVVLFLRGHLEIGDFTGKLSEMATSQLAKRGKRDKATTWIAQWLIGLTQKQFQNVLRSDTEGIKGYINDFEEAIAEAAGKCEDEFGSVRMELGVIEDPKGRRVRLDWKDIARLTTAIGSQTLAIRGSDKSMYGKLFERLILGSFLTILGFERVNPQTNTRSAGVFWLSDSRDLREADATLLVQPGRLARFDIGFIGAGNSEISKDKLSRYAREFELAGGRITSTTFIVVDRLPKSEKTQKAAAQIGAEIVQMSLRYWVRDLAQCLGKRMGVTHELQRMRDDEMENYLKGRLSQIRVQDLLSGVTAEELQLDEDQNDSATNDELDDEE